MNTRTVTAPLLRERLQADGDLLILDVRNGHELLSGKIPNAIHVPLGELPQRVRSVLPDLAAPIVIYCAHGVRSAHALRLLLQLGYTGVSHLEDGFEYWRSLGYPIEIEASNAAGERYSRQVLLESIGKAGQARLGQARVLIVGVGGLGSPAALYLAGAGVGTLGLVDPDAVDLTNLHRQIVHTTSRLGTKKVDSARAQLSDLNPEVKIKCFAERFSSDSADRILDVGWDVILDGGDNFPLRYLLNDVAVRRRISVCHGSIDRFEGRVTTFLGEAGPCYRCLFPQPPEPGTLGSCVERGVLGVLPGLIGVLQATEALKLILSIGKPLIGRMLMYDALLTEFREMRYAADPNCIACSQRRAKS